MRREWKIPFTQAKQAREHEKSRQKNSHTSFSISVSIFVAIDNPIKMLNDERQQHSIEPVQFYWMRISRFGPDQRPHEPCSVSFIENHTRESESILCHRLTYFMLISFLLKFSSQVEMFPKYRIFFSNLFKNRKFIQKFINIIFPDETLSAFCWLISRVFRILFNGFNLYGY